MNLSIDIISFRFFWVKSQQYSQYIWIKVNIFVLQRLYNKTGKKSLLNIDKKKQQKKVWNIFASILIQSVKYISQHACIV